MKKLVLSTLAVLAVTMSFAQELTKENVRINKKTGEREQVVRIRPHREAQAAQIAPVHRSDAKKARMVDIKKSVRPLVPKQKMKLQQRDEMKPKGNIKTK
jgi:hypothetical protein